VSKSTFTVALILLVGILLVTSPAVTAGDSWSRAVKGSGNITTEERSVPEFTRIELESSSDLEIEVGPEQHISVSFDDNLLEHVITEVRGGALEIDYDRSLKSRKGCLIKITVPVLEALSVTGSGDVDVVNIKGDEFEYTCTGSGDTYFEADVRQLDIRISGSGDLRTDRLTAEVVDVKISGSGDVRLDGTTTELNVRVAGSGDVDARGLLAEDAYVTIHGSGDVKVRSEKSLDGRIFGSGDIDYYGSPAQLSRKVLGSGDIRRRR
jgi:hypothetical protein